MAKKKDRTLQKEAKDEIVKEVLDACLTYIVEDTKLNLQLLMHKTEFYEKKRNDLLQDEPFWFQYAKKNKIRKELDEIEQSLLDCYAKIEEEIAIISKLKNPTLNENKVISFNDLLSLIEERKNPKRVRLNLCNDSAIYEYSAQDHSYILKDDDKDKGIFNTFLNESLTDLQMLENLIEII